MENNNNNDKNDLKGQLDMINHEFHNFAYQKKEQFGINCLHLECFPLEYNQDWNQFMKKLEKKIDAVRAKATPKHELYLNMTMMKTFCVIRPLLGLKYIDKEKFILVAEPILNKCQKALNPYKNQSEGLWLYILTQVAFVELINMRCETFCEVTPILKAEFRKGMEIIEDAEKHYTEFIVEKKIKPWGVDEIFSCYDKEGNQRKSELADNLQKLYDSNIKMLLLEMSIKTEDEPKIRKYGVEGLKVFMTCHRDHLRLHQLVRVALYTVQPFTNVHYFVQAQHIIAVVMHLVVEFRRSLPEKERTTVNPIQYDASYLYAEFGHRLCRKSWDIQMEPKFRDMGMNQLMPHNRSHHDECVRLMPESPALLQYEKVYPTKLTMDEVALKQMQGKVAQWVKRMDQLKKANTAPPDLCLKPLESIETRMPSIRGTASSNCCIS